MIASPSTLLHNAFIVDVEDYFQAPAPIVARNWPTWRRLLAVRMDRVTAGFLPANLVGFFDRHGTRNRQAYAGTRRHVSETCRGDSNRSLPRHAFEPNRGVPRLARRHPRPAARLIRGRIEGKLTPSTTRPGRVASASVEFSLRRLTARWLLDRLSPTLTDRSPSPGRGGQ
jgi:hypothetical protein